MKIRPPFSFRCGCPTAPRSIGPMPLSQNWKSGLGKVKGVESWFVIGGTDFTTQTNASNVATIVVITTPWDQRKTKDLQLNAILASTQRAFADVPEAFTTAFGFPPILGLSNTGGFQFMLEDRAGGELEQLSNVADTLVDAARKHPEIGNAVNTFRASVPTYSIDMNLDKLRNHGRAGVRRLQHAPNISGRFVRERL